jgi:predicted DNA-binding transcriptional regulator AlpA
MTGVPPKYLVGAHEIAERLGLSHAQSVHTIRKRHKDFPAPVATLRTAMIWDWREVHQWAITTGRLPNS